MKPGRREVALVLAASAIVTLLLPALRFDAPAGASWDLARKFWRGGLATRTLNSPLFAAHRDLAVAAYALNGKLPIESDVALVVSEGLPAHDTQEMRYRAAFLLAPRRVVVHRSPVLTGRSFRLVDRAAIPEPGR